MHRMNICVETTHGSTHSHLLLDLTQRMSLCHLKWHLWYCCGWLCVLLSLGRRRVFPLSVDNVCLQVVHCFCSH